MNIKSVVGYVRVSSIGQVEGDGLQRQIRSITDYCLKNNLELVNVFSDEGVSGTKQFRKGIQEVLNQDVTTVIVEGLDRLSRDLIVSETLIKKFRDHGIELISVKDGKDFDINPSRVMIRQMLGSVSQFEKSSIVERLRVSRQVKIDQGLKCGGRNGYDETHSHIIERVRSLRRKPKGRERLSYQGISDILNREGVKTISGKTFTRFIVGSICGQYLQQGN